MKMRKILLPDDSTNLGYWMYVNTDYFDTGENKKARRNFILWLLYTYVITLAQILVIKTLLDSFIEDLLESDQLKQSVKQLSKEEFLWKGVNDTKIDDIEDGFARA